MVNPNPPVSLVAISQDTQISLSWGIPLEIIGFPIFDYEISYSTNGTDWTVFSDGISTNPTALVTGLINEQNYLFRVRAENTDNEFSVYSNIVNAVPSMEPDMEYCTVKNVSDWLRVTIDANTNPNTTQINNIILMNQEEIDRLTGWSWQTNRQYTQDQMDVNEIYHYGRGMPIYLKHRRVKPFDSTLGDKVELWNGLEWAVQIIPQGNQGNFIYYDEVRGIMYIRGFLYTILRNNKFRITYRYGGAHEGGPIPRDIKKACILMTCMDILSTDFKFSQIAFGGEGNVSKKDITEKWQKEVDKIIWAHSEIFTTW